MPSITIPQDMLHHLLLPNGQNPLSYPERSIMVTTKTLDNGTILSVPMKRNGMADSEQIHVAHTKITIPTLLDTRNTKILEACSTEAPQNNKNYLFSVQAEDAKRNWNACILNTLKSICLHAETIILFQRAFFCCTENSSDNGEQYFIKNNGIVFQSYDKAEEPIPVPQILADIGCPFTSVEYLFEKRVEFFNLRKYQRKFEMIPSAKEKTNHEILQSLSEWKQHAEKYKDILFRT